VVRNSFLSTPPRSFVPLNVPMTEPKKTLKRAQVNKISDKRVQSELILKKNSEELKRDIIKVHGKLVCEVCHKDDKGTVFHIHHIIYRSERRNHPEIHNKRNLIHVCAEFSGCCHDLFHESKGNRDELVKERRLNELFGDDVLIKTK
jgi:hypothetical protein